MTVHQYVSRKPLNKEGKKPRTKALKIESLLFYMSWNSNTDAQKKQCTKEIKEKAAEHEGSHGKAPGTDCQEM